MNFFFVFIFCQDNVPPRYADAGSRQSRSRLDYDYGGGASQYREAYVDRLVSSKQCSCIPPTPILLFFGNLFLTF